MRKARRVLVVELVHQYEYRSDHYSFTTTRGVLKALTRGHEIMLPEEPFHSASPSQKKCSCTEARIKGAFQGNPGELSTCHAPMFRPEPQTKESSQSSPSEISASDYIVGYHRRTYETDHGFYYYEGISLLLTMILFETKPVVRRCEYVVLVRPSSLYTLWTAVDYTIEYCRTEDCRRVVAFSERVVDYIRKCLPHISVLMVELDKLDECIKAISTNQEERV